MAKLIGTAPNQVPTNGDLGSMAFEDRKNYVAKNGDGSVTISGQVTGPTTDTLLIKDSTGTTLKTIRGV